MTFCPCLANSSTLNPLSISSTFVKLASRDAIGNVTSDSMGLRKLAVGAVIQARLYLQIRVHPSKLTGTMVSSVPLESWYTAYVLIVPFIHSFVSSSVGVLVCAAPGGITNKGKNRIPAIIRVTVMRSDITLLLASFSALYFIFGFPFLWLTSFSFQFSIDAAARSLATSACAKRPSPLSEDARFDRG